MKWSKDSSVKYYQDNNGRLQKRACERYQSLSQEEKEENNNMGKSDIKISLKMKNKG